MRLSDVLGVEVVEADGGRCGRVHDVRLVQDGPMLGTFGAALRIDGLVIGPGAMGVRLGVHRKAGGPAVVKALFAHRRPWFVHWEDLEVIEPGVRVQLRPGAKIHGPPEDY